MSLEFGKEIKVRETNMRVINSQMVFKATELCKVMGERRANIKIDHFALSPSVGRWGRRNQQTMSGVTLW
jgi:hypothetical protein